MECVLQGGAHRYELGYKQVVIGTSMAINPRNNSSRVRMIM